MTKIVMTLALCCALFAGAAAQADDVAPPAALTRGPVLEALLVVSGDARWCHRLGAPRGGAVARCHAYLGALAGSIADAGETHSVDPWVLAAMAWVESRFNPLPHPSRNHRGEVGVMQLMPRYYRGLRAHRSPRRCRGETDLCQREIVDRTASALARRLRAARPCGELRAAINAHNLGRCRTRWRYADHVFHVRNRLMDGGHELVGR